MKPLITDLRANERYGIGKAAEILGIHRSTLLKAAKLGARQGGIDYVTSKRNGRKFFLGKELTRYWNNA